MSNQYNRSIIKDILSVLFLAGALLTNIPLQAQSPSIPACNTPVPFTNPAHPVSIVTGNMPGHIPVVNPQPWTGNFGVAVGGVTNAADAIDADTGTAAGFVYLLAVSGGARLTVQSTNGFYPAGYFAGFDIRNTSVLSATLLGTFSVKTYLGTTLRESYTGGSGLLTANLLSSGGITRIGFVTTLTFDRIQIEQDQTLSLSIGTTSILNPVITRFCAESMPRPCNTTEYWANPAFPVLVNDNLSGIVGLTCVNCTVRNTRHVTDSDPATYAEIDFLGAVASTGAISVKNTQTVYPAGTFAGFDILDIRAAGLAVGSTHTVTTFLNGTQQESVTDGTGLSGGFFTSSGRSTTGFKTTLPFNEIQLKVTHTGAAGASPTRVYGAVVKRFCAGAALLCNTNTAMTDPLYPVFVDGRNTYVDAIGCVQCDILNTGYAIDADPSNYTQLVIPAAVATEAAYAVSDGATLYPAGTFAGFDIENPNLVGAGALGGLTIATTLSDGTIVQSFTGGNLISASTSLLSGSGRQTVGFVATQPFNGVKIIASSAVNANIGTTRIYSAVFKSFCPRSGSCSNLPTYARNPEWPVYVNGVRTGINTIGCVGCQINNPGNVIDADTTNYAEMVLLAGVGSQGQLSVKDQLATYPAGGFAGMAVSAASLLQVDALSAFTINTYNNGTLAESKTGTALLVSANTSLLTGTGSMIAGFITTQPFDEVQIVATNLASVDLGTLRIYGAIFQEFCPKTVLCNTHYALTQPDFPVVIDAGHTGITGLACAVCYVHDADHLLTADTSDYATIFTGVGAGSIGSVAVQDALSTYPKGTFAGFGVQGSPTILLASLLPGLTVSTYLNGSFQESRSSGNLIDLDILIPLLGPGNGLRNVGFVTTLPFDEIRLSASGLASLGINHLKVYYALVDTRTADDPATLDCSHTVSGSVLNDANGLNDLPPTVSGTGVNGPDIDAAAPGAQALYVSLVQNGQVVSTVSVGTGGTYSFPAVTNGDYNAVLHGNPSGSTAPSLYPEWVNTGEHAGAGSGHDGNPNGILPLSGLSSDTTAINFGVNRRPVPDTIITPNQLDPGGNNFVPIPPNAFAGTDPEADGAIISILITAFPANCDGMNINGTVYTAGNFPVAGVTVPANASGQPTQPISVNPSSGSLLVVIPYRVTDLAGTSSSAIGQAQVPVASVLPVELGTVTATAGSCVVHISFETLSEKDSRAFVIEHSTNASSWATLAVLPAAGNSNKRQVYHYNHRGAEGLQYYRIRYSSAGGSALFSKVVSAHAGCSEMIGDIRIYPNPARDLLYMDGAPAGTDVSIYNVTGSLLRTATVRDGMIRISDLPSGHLYLLRIRHTGEERSFRFFKL